MASASVDRLNQIPARLAVLSTMSQALDDPGIREEMNAPGARAWSPRWPELSASPRLDRPVSRGRRSGGPDQSEGKDSSPGRIVLTGRADGPELDLLVPAIDRGAELPPDAGIPAIVGCRERAAAFAAALAQVPTP